MTPAEAMRKQKEADDAFGEAVLAAAREAVPHWTWHRNAAGIACTDLVEVTYASTGEGTEAWLAWVTAVVDDGEGEGAYGGSVVEAIEAACAEGPEYFAPLRERVLAALRSESAPA